MRESLSDREFFERMEREAEALQRFVTVVVYSAIAVALLWVLQ